MTVLSIHQTPHPAWVFNNIWKRWSSIARRHAATKSSASATLSAQFSGYGANATMVNRALDVLGVRCVRLSTHQGVMWLLSFVIQKQPKPYLHIYLHMYRDPVDLGNWDEERVEELVEAFLQVRFPTILLLNKADQVSRGRGEVKQGNSRILMDPIA